MVLSTAIGITINLLEIESMRALFLTAIINGLVAPPILILIVLLGSSRDVMGARTSGRLSKTLTWATAAVMSAAAIALVASLVA
jgi:Mn2+/Fe2+ NRAMP family transporter